MQGRAVFEVPESGELEVALIEIRGRAQRLGLLGRRLRVTKSAQEPLQPERNRQRHERDDQADDARRQVAPEEHRRAKDDHQRPCESDYDPQEEAPQPSGHVLRTHSCREQLRQVARRWMGLHRA